MNRSTPADYQRERDARQHRAMLARRADRATADRIRATLSHSTAADAVALSDLLSIGAL